MTADRVLLRRAILFGTPLLYIVLGIIHPFEDPRLGDATQVFIALHFAQLFLIAGLAWSLWLLVEGLESRAATVTRVLIVPYAILYTALDSIAGLGMGGLVQVANDLPVAQQAVADRIIVELDEPDVAGYALWLGAGLSWFAAAFAATLALKGRGPRAALVLMALGALIFAVGHPKPPGPVGMALFFAGVVWLELRRREAEAPQAVSAQPA
ncbi:MAG TPA: hypothetical protein VNO56_04905 [Gaiellaceae bacterium]|nr:hypothetical protein [Gaiellaceae bacterium]